MQIFILALVILIFGYDAQAHEGRPAMDLGAWGWGVFLIPKLLLAIGYAAICKRAYKSLGTVAGMV